MKITKAKIAFFIIIDVIFLIVLSYFIPVSHKTFFDFEDGIPQTILAEYRQFANETAYMRSIEVNGKTWHYKVAGKGRPLLLLHGMGGESDFWWQQFQHYAGDFTVIAPTYPEADSLTELADGVLAILDHEKTDRTVVMGTSLGGYLTQYLLSVAPQRFERAAFLNTFPPNDILNKKNRWQGLALRIMPGIVVMSVYRKGLEKMVIPASGDSPLLRAHVMPLSYGGMTKSQLYGRYLCVMEKFTPPTPTIPLLIVDADNDPLVPAEVRELLVATYPEAKRVTLHKTGHFPYISQPQEFYAAVDPFLKQR